MCKKKFKSVVGRKYVNILHTRDGSGQLFLDLGGPWASGFGHRLVLSALGLFRLPILAYF